MITRECETEGHQEVEDRAENSTDSCSWSYKVLPKNQWARSCFLVFH